MNTELETRLRATLRARAEDVDASPVLWEQVADRTTRRRRARLALLAGGLAVAGVAAAVGLSVLADVLGDAPQELEVVDQPPSSAPSPSTAPTPSPAPTASAAPTRSDVDAPAATGPTTPVLTADRDAVHLDGTDGTRERTVLQLAEGGAAITHLAVRPGSTVDDLTAVVVLETADGAYELRTVRVVDGEASDEAFPAPHQPGPVEQVFLASSGGPGLQVAWAPDGRHLAWTELAPDFTTSLRVIGWDDGPGTGRTADDNASFGLPQQLPAAIVEDWVWDVTSGDDEATGRLVLARRGVDGPEGVTALAIERQGDGAIALPDELAELSGAMAGVIDLDLLDGGASALRVRVVARVDGGEELAAELVAEDGTVVDLPLPPDLQLLADSSTRLRLAPAAADGAAALVTDLATARTWVLTASEATALPDGVLVADVVD